MAPPPMFSVREIADAWGMSPNTVYDLINAGDLGYVNVGQTGARPRIRVPQPAIEAFLRERGRNLPVPERRTQVRRAA